MVPTDCNLISADLLHHLHELLLVHSVNGLNTDGGSSLGHGEYINHCNGIVIDYIADHQAHDLEGDACPCVLEHFDQSQGRDIDLFSGVMLRLVNSWLPGSHSTALCLLEESLKVHIFWLIIINLK